MDTMTINTFAGPLSIVVDTDGIVVASGFATDLGRLLAEAGIEKSLKRRRDLGAVSRAVRAYIDGELDAIDAVAVHQHETPTIGAMRRVLRSVPPGTVVSYAQLAAKAGFPGAARAAGTACSRNAVAPFVPCHRVVRADGSIGNYGYGVWVKEALLAHEGAIL